MHTIEIIAKTVGTLGLLLIEMLLFGIFVEGDILGQRGLTVRQIAVLVVVLCCIVGIWIL